MKLIGIKRQSSMESRVGMTKSTFQSRIHALELAQHGSQLRVVRRAFISQLLVELTGKQALHLGFLLGKGVVEVVGMRLDLLLQLVAKALLGLGFDFEKLRT